MAGSAGSPTRRLTSEEALGKALDWAEGRLSHWNAMMDQEGRDALGVPDGARQQTIVRTAEADAAEVAKWMAVAAGLRKLELLEREYVPREQSDALAHAIEFVLDLSDDWTREQAAPGELIGCTRPVEAWNEVVAALNSYREATGGGG